MLATSTVDGIFLFYYSINGGRRYFLIIFKFCKKLRVQNSKCEKPKKPTAFFEMMHGEVWIAFDVLLSFESNNILKIVRHICYSGSSC